MSEAEAKLVQAPGALAASEPERASASGMPTPVDYFGFAGTERSFLPDKVSFVEIKIMNEGDRRNYLNKTNREVNFQKGGMASMTMQPGDDRYQLLKQSIVGWNLVRGGNPIAFSPNNLDLFLRNCDPRIADGIEKDIRKFNPWMLQETSLEDMIRERDALNEMIEVKEREELGKDS
jgi:hypothetical protein